MSDKSPNDIQKTDCCAQGECCSSSTANQKQWWKIAVFALGMLLVVSGITYSLVTRHSAASNVPLGQGAIPAIGSNASKSAAAAMGIGELTWVQNLTALFSKNDFVFVILPKGDDDSAKAVAIQVTGAAEKIRAEGVSVSSMTLSSSDPEFTTTTERLGISQLPAVLIVAKSGNGAIVTGNLDETKLLQAYLVVSNPTCPPGSSSGCCPK